LNLSAQRQNWDLLASTDPLWAILTDPSKRNNGWSLDEFFATGVGEIDAALSLVESIHPLPSKHRALDFGCGVGRLTQALGDRFDEVCGVDISPAMIDLAGKYNRHGDRCRFHLNSRSDLNIFPSKHFDFVYSCITLQHVEPRFAKLYIQEFIRVLAPGGIAVFQLPSRAPTLAVRYFLAQHLIGAFLRRIRADYPILEMYGVKKEEVLRLLKRADGQILDIRPDHSAGPQWESYRYIVTRHP
jgi:SAM-dependent methyltransferase